MTCALNGNIGSYSNIKPLTKFFHYCAGLKCKLFHREQIVDKPSITCINNWETRHSFIVCQNKPRCTVCKHSGHSPSSGCLSQYREDNSSKVSAFNGKKSVLSNFITCDLQCLERTLNRPNRLFNWRRQFDLMIFPRMKYHWKNNSSSWDMYTRCSIRHGGKSPRKTVSSERNERPDASVK